MEGILDTIRQMVMFCLVNFVVLELAPKEEYKKYLNTFAGMILILIAINPFSDILNFKNDYEEKLSRFLLKNEINNDVLYFGEYDELRADAIVGEYQGKIEDTIRQIVEEEQFVAESVKVDLNTDVQSDQFLEVESVNLCIARKYEQNEIKIKEILLNSTDTGESIQEINIKNKISQFYNVEMSNINISK